MPDQPFSFHDFGIHPEGLGAPGGVVRSYFSKGRIAGQYIGAGIVSAIGLGLLVLFAFTLSLPFALLGWAAALAGFGAFLFLITHNDYGWVELDGNTLRARHLYTGRMIERPVGEIECLAAMVYQVKRPETVVIEKMLGRVKGIEIRFRDGRTPLRILRSDPAMTNAQELIEAVIFRMSHVREIEADVVNLEGKPLVRNIHWKGETPSPPPGKGLKATLGALIALALMFGAILAIWGHQEEERRALASVPPHEIAVHKLIQSGPGPNRHVIVTDFRPGGYAFEAKSGTWTQVWVALFPAAQPDDGKEIKVILSSKSVRDEAGLMRLLSAGRVQGICSQSPRSSWGTVLGPQLVKVNPGRELNAAWSIDELREPPSAGFVTALLAGGAACLAAVVILAMIVFWKAG